MKEIWHGYVDLGLIHSMAFPATGKGDGPFAETLKTIANDLIDDIKIKEHKSKSEKSNRSCRY